IDVANAKRCKPCRQIWIAELAVEDCLLEVSIEDIDRAGVEVGCINEIAMNVGAQRQPLVDGASDGIVDSEDCMVLIGTRVPGANRPIFGIKDEDRRQRRARNIEALAAIPNDARGSRSRPGSGATRRWDGDGE